MTSLGGLAFGIALGLGLRSKSRRVPPSGPRLRRPDREGPRSRPFIDCPSGPGRASNGGFRFAIHGSAETAGRRGRPPDGPDPFEALACGYRPRGWHPPALSNGKVACGESEELGFASWVGTPVGLLCMASVAIDTSRVRARACAPTPQTADHALDMRRPALPPGVGAHDVGEKPTKRRRRTLHVCDRSRHNPPQSWKEPAGSPLGAGSRRRGIRTVKARRGPARTAGHFR
ncbi:hypothetical protein ACVKN3_002799 [Luteibacter sp. PvP120]